MSALDEAAKAQKRKPGMAVWGFLLGVLGNIGYESALVYYNAYLPDLAPRTLGGVLAWAKPIDHPRTRARGLFRPGSNDRVVPS